MNDFTHYAGSVPITLFAPEESLEVFNQECASDKAGLSGIYKTAEKRFFSKHPNT